MACIIQGEIDRIKLQDIISSIFLPLKFKIIEDFSEMAESDFLNFDGHFEMSYVSNQTHSWIILETLFGGNRLSFEFEEYLAYQLNRQYDWVTVADSYRLMADRLRGDVLSGYYSILFEKDRSIFLVDNTSFDDEHCLNVKKLACIYPVKKRLIVNQYYIFSEYQHECYIGIQSEEFKFDPVMRCDYIPLKLKNLISQWKIK